MNENELYSDFYFDDKDKKADDVDRKVGVYSYRPVQPNWSEAMSEGQVKEGNASEGLKYKMEDVGLRKPEGMGEPKMAPVGGGSHAADPQGTGQPAGETAGTVAEGRTAAEPQGTGQGESRAERKRNGASAWDEIFGSSFGLAEGTGLAEDAEAPSSVNNVADYKKDGGIRSARINAINNVGGERGGRGGGTDPYDEGDEWKNEQMNEKAGGRSAADPQGTGQRTTDNGQRIAADPQGTGEGKPAGETAGTVAGGRPAAEQQGTVAMVPTMMDAGTSGAGREWNNEVDQSWDGLQRYLDRLDSEYEKKKVRNAWWELMTRGLVGAANMAGTMAGAPSMDLSGSANAFDSKDAYARLKDKKTQVSSLVMKQMEQLQKERELERKLVDSENNYKIKLQNLENNRLKLEMARDKASDEKIKAEYDIEIKRIQKEMKEVEQAHQQTKFDLEDQMKRSSIYRNQTAAEKNKKGGSSGGGSKGKGEYIEIGGKGYTIASGRGSWFLQKCAEAGMRGYGFESKKKILDYIANYPNSSEVKKLKKLLGV